MSAPFVIKTISLRVCRRCRTAWSGEDVQLEQADQINIMRVTIAYCPACAEDFAAETDRPTYNRVGKRIK
jgi:hypothetical protein